MTARGSVREQEIPPRASVLVESLRDIGYSLQTAIADVIDNSLTAGARNIELLADTHAQTPAIGILDDGAGMTEPELLGSDATGKQEPPRGPDDHRPRSIRSRTQDGVVLAVSTVDRRHAHWRRGVVRGLGSRHGRGTRQVDCRASARHCRDPVSERLVAGGTLVVWERLDRLVVPDGGTDRRDLVAAARRDGDTPRVRVSPLPVRQGGQGRARADVFSTVGAVSLRSVPFAPSGDAAPSRGAIPARRREIRIRPVTLPITTRSRRPTGSVMRGGKGM